MAALAIVVVLCWLTWRMVEYQQVRQRELGRFTAFDQSVEANFEQRLEKWLELLGRQLVRKHKEKAQAKEREKDIGEKLRDAGLDSAAERGRYVFIRFASFAVWPIIVAVAWANFTTYYATVTSVFSLALVVLVPHLWLSRRTIGRLEEIQRELPLVIDLTNLATSAGWDVSVALEKVIDSLAPEFPGHPLLREFRRARWLVSSGYTWSEGLERVSDKLGDDTVKRVTEALCQAMEKGGDRSSQLAGIAADAQRTYYAALDKRLASIPVKALIITMILFLTYFAVLLAPSGVNVMDNVSFIGG